MSTGGGDNIEVGGISASIELETNELTADLKKAEAALKATGQQIKELEAYIQATGGKVGEFDAALKELNVTKMALVRQVGQLRQAIKEEGTEAQAATGQVKQFGAATQAAATSIDTAMVKVGGSMRSTRMAMHSSLMVGSDLATGSVQGLTSHLERLGYGMSAVAGLSPIMGAAIGAGFFLAAAGVKQLVEHWDDLRVTFGFDSTKTEADHMEELGKKTHKTADETKRLNDYKREQAEIEAMMGLKTSGEQASGKAGQEALAETGVNEVETALKNAMKREGTYYGADKQSEELKKKKATLAKTAQQDMAKTGKSDVSELTKNLMLPYLEEVKQLEDKIGGRTDKNIERLMNQVIHGTPAEQEAANAKIAGILGKHSDLAPDQAIARLKESSVEGRGKRLEAELTTEQEEGAAKYDKEVQARQEAEGQKKLRNKQQEEADYIKSDVTRAHHDAHREARATALREAAEKSRDEEMGEATAGWDPKTMKGRKGLRQEAAQRVADAEEEAPGVGKQAEAGTAALMARGASPEKAAEMIGAQVAKALEKAGMTPEEAKAASVDVAAKAGHDVKEKITKKALDDKGAEAKASETFKAEDLQNRLQSAVGKDDKKMSLEDASIQALADKFKANGLRWNVV